MFCGVYNVNILMTRKQIISHLIILPSMDPVSLRHWLAGCWVGGGGGENIAVVAYKGVLQTMHQGICMDLISTGKNY